MPKNLGQCKDCSFEFSILSGRNVGRWGGVDRVPAKYQDYAFYGNGRADHCPNCGSKEIEKIEQMPLFEMQP